MTLGYEILLQCPFPLATVRPERAGTLPQGDVGSDCEGQ